MADGQQDGRNRILCRFHPDANLIEDCHAGDVVCSECGLVVGDRVIDVSAEWRSFKSEDGSQQVDKCRVGAAIDPLQPNKGLTTYISYRLNNGGRDLDQLSRWNDKFKWESYDRKPRVRAPVAHLRGLHRVVQAMVERLNLPVCMLDASCKTAQEYVLNKGPDGKMGKLRTLAASCLYIACSNDDECTRSLMEICSFPGISLSRVRRLYRAILKTRAPKDATSDDLLSKICTMLALPKTVHLAVRHIIDRITELELAEGYNSDTVTGVAIYLASIAIQAEKSCRLRLVATAVDVQEKALYQLYQQLRPRKAELLPHGYPTATPRATSTASNAATSNAECYTPDPGLFRQP